MGACSAITTLLSINSFGKLSDRIMPRDSLSNDTHDADEHNKPQSKTVTGGTVTDCGFRNLSMFTYATTANSNYGAVPADNQQQGSEVRG